MDNQRTSVRSLAGYLGIIRLPLALSAAACALAAALLSGLSLDSGSPGFPPLAALALTVFFISSGTMPLNDIIDEAADRINAPHRPLPSGQLSRTQALAVHIGHSAVGLVFAAAIGIPAFVFTSLIYINATVYSFVKGRMLFIPNLQVSLSVAAVFMAYGVFIMEPGTGFFAVLSSGLLPVFVPVAFLTSLQLEIAGDILDEDGDRKNGDSSLAVNLGLPAVRGVLAAIGIVHLVISSYLLLSIPQGSTFPAGGPRGLLMALAAADGVLTAAFTIGFLSISRNPPVPRRAGLRLIYAYFISMTVLMVAGGVWFRILQTGVQHFGR
jgi:geranylgeranylglycerol-phosphate geranylgeranyltransferase